MGIRFFGLGDTVATPITVFVRGFSADKTMARTASRLVQRWDDVILDLRVTQSARPMPVLRPLQAVIGPLNCGRAKMLVVENLSHFELFQKSDAGQ